MTNLSVPLQLGLLGLGVATIWLWTSPNGLRSLWLWRRKQTNGQQINRETLLQILDDISRSTLQILTELSQMVASIQRSLRSRGLEDAVAQPQMEAMLMGQGFELRLKAAEADVHQRYNVTEDAVAQAYRVYQNDANVAEKAAGLSLMFSEALHGILPLLPGVPVPDTLKSPDVVLRLIEEIQKRKLEIFTEILQTADPSVLRSAPQSDVLGPLPSPELNTRLTAGAQQAERDILDRSELGATMSTELFRHALAAHSRDSDFKLRKAVIDDLYSEKIVEAMRLGLQRLNNAPPAPTVVMLHDKMEHVKAEELATVVKSAQESERPVICLVTEQTNDAAGMTALQQYASAIKDIESGVAPPVEASFLFATAKDFQDAFKDDPLISHPTGGLARPLYYCFLPSQPVVVSENADEVVQRVKDVLQERKKKDESDHSGQRTEDLKESHDEVKRIDISKESAAVDVGKEELTAPSTPDAGLAAHD